MTLSKQQTDEIAELLTRQIRRKLTQRKAEPSEMPFHVRLLGKDRMAVFSFVQSINTTIGQDIFEPIAVIVARPRFRQAISQYKKFNDTISADAQYVIQQLMNDLTTARIAPNKEDETKRILAVVRSGEIQKIKRPRIDLFLESKNGIEYYIDMKTAKPNAPQFVAFKRTLLEWVGIRGVVDPEVEIRTMLAIPYNPYEPEPYQRWTLQGLFDLKNEILVAVEFWDFLGGTGTYEELLDVFEKVGIALRPEIDAKFAKLS
ncbi:MAG: TdeIII family type II restriction endonuclease [Chloroflexi bacterium]|nr:TdeIII family type II restriction endonuclease [Chloroflexota bacterium]